LKANSFCVILNAAKPEDQPQAKAKSSHQPLTKDDAYDEFIKEMEGLL